MFSQANELAKSFYKGVMEFDHEGQTWTIEGVRKIKEKKGWRKVLVVRRGEERVFLDID